jgi:hypothetical protein
MERRSWNCHAEVAVAGPCMSALTPQADIATMTWNIDYVPKAIISISSSSAAYPGLIRADVLVDHG